MTDIRRGGRLSTVVTVLLVAGVLAVAPAAAADPVTPQRYAPLIYLHPDDVDLPMSAASFVAHSRLRWSHDGGCPDHQLAGIGAVDATALGGGGYAHQEEDAFCQHTGGLWASSALTRPRGSGGTSGGEGFFLDLDNTFRPGEGTSAPMYYDYRPGAYVTYWFLYGFDDAPTEFADHEGDWERISLRLDPADQPTTVAFFQHSGYCTLSWTEVTRSGDHPVGYSALGTHATYPTPGTHGLDSAAAGPGWLGSNLLSSVRDQGWYGFGGAWGEVGNYEQTTGPLGPSAFKPPTPADWSGPHC